MIRILVHLLPIAGAYALHQASTPHAGLTRRAALLGAGALAAAVPTSVLAGDEAALGEFMGLIDGMRTEAQERFVTGPSRTVMVTGASTSAGFEAAKKVATGGARVIVTAGTEAQADELAAQLRETTGSKTVFSMQLNLADKQSVKSSPARLAKALGISKPIDCMLENDGILPIPDPTGKSLFDPEATLFYCRTSGRPQ
jgi:hypothetical protein